MKCGDLLTSVFFELMSENLDFRIILEQVVPKRLSELRAVG